MPVNDKSCHALRLSYGDARTGPMNMKPRITTGSADATAHELGHESAAMLFRHYRAVVTREAAQAFFGLRP